MRSPTPINILLVEDDPADVELTRRGLGRGKVQNRLWVVGDGVDALAFLRRGRPLRRRARPCLPFSALNGPHLGDPRLMVGLLVETRRDRVPYLLLHPPLSHP